MDLKLIKNNEEKYALIYEETGKIIENYDLLTTIDFSLLMRLLLEDELTNKYSLLDCDFEMNDEERVLFNLIKSIVEKYNGCIDSYNHFLDEKNKK